MAKITWTFRNEEGANLNRYIATNVSTGEKITFDLLRSGNISVVGTPLNAENLNDLITSINACYDLISSSEKDTTYTLSKNGNAIRLTSSDGTTNDVTLNKDDVGLSNVDNTSDMDKPISNATQTELNKKANTIDLNSHINNTNNPHNVNKAQVGLGNVDNTSDLNKPVSILQQNEMNKTLYNLGAFDTVTDNEDGTVTITRKTGYLTINAENVESIWSSSNNKGCAVVMTNYIIDNFKYVGTSSYGLVMGVSVFGAVKVIGGNDIGLHEIGFDATYKSVFFGMPKNTTLEESKSVCPIELQYELATGYTEKVLKNQRNNYVDDFSRSQWEKSVNLFDINTVTIGTGYDYVANASDWVKAINIPVKPNTTYSSSYPITRYCFNHENIVADYNQNTITTSADTTTLSLFFYVGNYSGTVREWFSNYMLNEGDHALPYQPYDYSGHIQNEQGRYLIEHEEDARNLAKPLIRTVDAIMSYDIAEIDLKAGTYTLSISGPNDTSGAHTINIYDNSSGVPVKVLQPTDTAFGSYRTFTLDRDVKGFITSYFNAVHPVINIMLNKGKKPLPYTPYNSKEHITNLQADLLELEEKRSRNVWDEQWEQGMFDGSGQPAPGSLKIRTKNFIQASPNTAYTLCYPTDLGADVYEYDENENFINYINCPHKNTSFTTKSNTKYLKFRLSSDYGDTYKRDIVLVKGTEALPYEPYAGQIIHEKEFNEKLNEKQTQINELKENKLNSTTSDGISVESLLKLFRDNVTTEVSVRVSARTGSMSDGWHFQGSGSITILKNSTNKKISNLTITDQSGRATASYNDNGVISYTLYNTHSNYDTDGIIKYTITINQYLEN